MNPKTDKLVHVVKTANGNTQTAEYRVYRKSDSRFCYLAKLPTNCADCPENVIVMAHAGSWRFLDAKRAANLLATD